MSGTGIRGERPAIRWVRSASTVAGMSAGGVRSREIGTVMFGRQPDGFGGA